MPRGIADRGAKPCRGEGCKVTLPAIRGANSEYCPACRPGQGEFRKGDLCPCQCGNVGSVRVGARFYCEATARILSPESREALL